METSRVVSHVRVEAIGWPYVEWQHQGVVASRVRMALHCEAIRRVAARMDVRADGGHWSWAGAAGKRVDA